MSFLTIPKSKKMKTSNFIKHRKEQNSLSADHFHLIFRKIKERASAFTSTGSITLEAALVVPIFFFAILCMSYMFEIMAIQTTMKNALYSVGKEISKQAYMSPIISTSGIESHIINEIGAEKLNQSMIVNGAKGIDCSGSRSNWNTAVIDLSVRYDLQIPVLMFRIPVISREETLRVKGWTGYVEGVGGNTKEEVVYVTEYGLVYHKDLHCTYLEMAITGVNREELEELRNHSGAKYYACELCKPGEEARVFITTYGTRYHASLDCAKIKRNIYAISADEAYGLGGCSKCVK